MQPIIGQWSGTNRLWMDPSQPPLESATIAEVSFAAGNRFLAVRYTWSLDGPQDGLLLIALTPGSEAVTAAWVDGFHSGDRMMPCRGESAPDGSLSVLGSYSAPPGPDWGWRITLGPTASGALRIAMDNIAPDGTAYPAVEAVYARAS